MSLIKVDVNSFHLLIMVMVAWRVDCTSYVISFCRDKNITSIPNNIPATTRILGVSFTYFCAFMTFASIGFPH